MTDNNGMYMPVAPAYGMGYGNGNGNDMFGGNSGWWILILLILFGGWGNGNGNWGGNNGAGSEVQRGFDQSAIMGGINGLTGSVANGFANVNQAMCNGFAQAEIAANARQMADMNQNFGMQTAFSNQLNGIAMNQQNCCCENRAAVADLKYTVATEACNDRAAVDGALRDVTAQGVANTQALMNTMNAGIQAIKDQMCNDKIDAKNERIAELERQLTMANLAASQGQQTAQILANNEAQTAALERYLAPTPIPAYVVQNPNCCANNFGCGCGGYAA